ncbi:hypothetical protein [Streptomyces gibsoniae]|uniref:Transposase n=1 Tax=Streptomyces gibsoniae TaxID=3075529 RepID=A0ABU2TUZ5_9ACTN|nr:hypothetical protein [Streptomyces sp. DSM 41699]MDT0464778.1 hypothetical protein [Streptomyces sp. DSM 41699]
MTSDSPMPSPPFPSLDNAVFRLVVGNAIASVRSEDECPGCGLRGDLPRHSNRS